MKTRVLLDEPADATSCVKLDTAVTARVIDLGAKQSRFCFGTLVARDEFAQVGAGKTISVHDQHRIRSQTPPGKANGPGGSQRLRLNYCFDRQTVTYRYVAAQKIDDGLRL